MKVILWLAALAAILFWVFKGVDTLRKVKPLRFLSGFIAMVGVSIVMATIVVIPAGHRGVVFNQTSGIEQRILGEGVSFIMPLVESVIKADVRIDRASATGTAASKDTQQVDIKIVTNYRLDPSHVNWIYQNIGEREAVIHKIIAPAVQEEVKAATPRFTAIQIVQKRHDVKALILSGLEKRLARSHVLLTDITLADIQFDPAFDRAIEEKVKAEQEALKEQNVVAINQARAQQAIATSEGKKRSTILEAEGEAEKSRLLGDALRKNPEVLRQLWIQKWNGQLPTYFSSNGASGLLMTLPIAK